MLKDLNITLYDIFGYLLPGGVFLLALSILFHSLIAPSQPIDLSKIFEGKTTLIILIAYILGHFSQAIANWIKAIGDCLKINIWLRILNKRIREICKKKNDSQEMEDSNDSVPKCIDKELFKAARSSMSTFLNIDENKITWKVLSDFCEEVVAQHGDTKDRDMYIYRIGFYRGLAISSFILLISSFVGKFLLDKPVIISGLLEPKNHSILNSLIFICIFSTLAFYKRHLRFQSHRHTQIINGFLVLYTSKMKK